MKRILNLFLIAGALTLLPDLATAKQSVSAAQPRTTTSPQEKASHQASSPKRHRRARTNTSHRRRHRKTSAKH